MTAVSRALAAQTQALVKLLGKRDEGDEFGVGLIAQTATGGASVKGGATRELMLRALRERPGTFSLRVQSNIRQALGPESRSRSAPDVRRYLERYGCFAQQQSLGYMTWAVAGVLNALWAEEWEAAADQTALLLVALEQVALDGGRWDVGWTMTLGEEPPWGTLARPASSLGLRTFPRSADQAWCAAALAWIKELDTITARRRELAPRAGSRAAARAAPQGRRHTRAAWRQRRQQRVLRRRCHQDDGLLARSR